MKIGLIARCEIARGLAIQAKNFYDHMPVEKVLCVRMPRPDAAEQPSWYANRTDVRYDPRNHTLEDSIVLEWLDGLDVVFCVETPHDWRVPLWCKDLGVKLVVQGNPEFVRHMRDDNGVGLAHPDQWWWPTTWRLDKVPPGIVMPVPMDPHVMPRDDDMRLHVLHVIGKRAWADRNGTEVLVQSMRSVRSKVKLTVCSIDGDIIPFARSKNVEMVLRPNATADLWSMYEDQDVLVLPRRYGGLSLPALEASAAGLVVAMTDCSPNQELAAVLMPSHRSSNLMMAAGNVVAWDSRADGVARTIDTLADARGGPEFETLQDKQRGLLPTWDKYRPKYLAALENLCEGRRHSLRAPLFAAPAADLGGVAGEPAG